ncbi:MAG: hypothetical protein LLF78_08625 [Synergistaceae bacterium]|nr:hypothetical protein [Synergistaceae bacterium]
MYYKIGRQLEEITQDKITKNGPFIAVLSSAEYKAKDLPDGFTATMIPRYEHIHSCKAEVMQDILCGTFSVPRKKLSDKRISFAFCIKKTGVLFVDDSDLTQSIIKKIAETVAWKEPSIGHFFYTFMETLIENDLGYLEAIENRLSKLEASVLADELDSFIYKIVAIRKEILACSHYYSQLTDIGLVLLEDENELFSPSALPLFKLFSDRAHRLREETQMLREYSLQISEAYQTQIDIRQNIVMKVLTVVTTIFLPLSLLAGWYGMNFKNMPELQWRYGYHLVIFVSICIVIYCLWIFKKKKFW